MKIKELSFCAVMCSLLCVLSPLVIPFGPIGITFSTLIIGIICMLFKVKQVFLILILYLVLGCLGLPIFSGFSGGIGHILGPTGGFILGYFPFAAAVLIIRRLNKSNLTNIIALSCAYMILYLCGITYYCITTKSSISGAIYTVILPFLIPDFSKILLTNLLSSRIKENLLKK